MLGRTFTPEEDAPGAARAVVISHALWRARFGGDPTILGRSLRLDGASFTVVGVMPPAFRYPTGAGLWTPIAPELAEIGRRQKQDLLGQRGFGVLHAVGRLKHGISVENAQSDLTGLIRGEWRKNHRMLVTPLIDDYFGHARTALLVALGAVFLLLAIACFNVAGLLLARIVRRRQEWALRRAIGGTTADIARLSVVETALIGLAATVAGWMAVPVLVKLVLALDPTGVIADYPVEIDRRVLGISIVVSVTTIMLASLGPTLQALRLALNGSLSLTLRHRPSVIRVRRVFVVVQVGLTVVLLVGAGLMVRSVMRLSRLDLGFNPDRLLVVSGAEYGNFSRERHDAIVDTLVTKLQGLPGVRRVLP